MKNLNPWLVGFVENFGCKHFHIYGPNYGLAAIWLEHAKKNTLNTVYSPYHRSCIGFNLQLMRSVQELHY